MNQGARPVQDVWSLLVIGVVVILAYVGWILVSLMILAQQTLVAVFPSLNTVVALALSTFLTLVTVVVGYQLILRLNRVMVWLSGLALVLTLGYTRSRGGARRHRWWWWRWCLQLDRLSGHGVGCRDLAAFVRAVRLGLLPLSAVLYHSRSAFWYTYFGTLLGAAGAMIVGALLVAGLGADAQLASLSRIMPGPLFVFVMLVFFFGAIDAGVINMYGSSLCTLTCIQAFKLKWSPKSSARNIRTGDCDRDSGLRRAVGFSMTSWCTVLELHQHPDLPADSVEHRQPDRLLRSEEGHYDPASFSDPKSGYGAFNVPAVLSYFLGFVVPNPFHVNGVLSGAVAGKIGGIDTAWIVGTVATFFIYLGLIKLWRIRQVSRDAARTRCRKCTVIPVA